ncbi:MAG: TlpA disulfide reductase family protein [Marinirhabdus sp.]|nr:TlpA disulfide reductase family protein [Marinirhabdus sp.]
MKVWYLICIAVFLNSCGNQGEQNASNSNIDEGELILTDADQSKEANRSEALPILDFTELEEKYLTPASSEKTYVLNFWATWCKPCVKELPYFERLRATYASQIEVVLVSLDFPENIDKQVVPFIAKHNLLSTIVLLDDPDANTWIPKVDKSWSGAIPATLIIKGDRKEFYEQSFTYTELEKEVQSIL